LREPERLRDAGRFPFLDDDLFLPFWPDLERCLDEERFLSFSASFAPFLAGEPERFLDDDRLLPEERSLSPVVPFDLERRRGSSPPLAFRDPERFLDRSLDFERSFFLDADRFLLSLSPPRSFFLDFDRFRDEERFLEGERFFG